MVDAGGRPRSGPATPAEIAGSHQANCIVYSQLVNPRRRSGRGRRLGGRDRKRWRCGLLGRGPKKIVHWEHWSCPDAETYLAGIDYYAHPRLCRLKLQEVYPQLNLPIPAIDDPIPLPRFDETGPSSDPNTHTVRWGDSETATFQHGEAYFHSPEEVFAFSPLEKGDFKAVNLDVQLQNGDEPVGVDLVAANQLQFGLISAEEVIKARANARPVVQVYEWFQKYPVGIVAPEGVFGRVRASCLCDLRRLRDPISQIPRDFEPRLDKAYVGRRSASS